MITELKARDIEKNLKTVKNLATYNVGITNSHNIIIVNLCLPTFTGLDFLDNFALTSVVFCFQSILISRGLKLSRTNASYGLYSAVT